MKFSDVVAGKETIGKATMTGKSRLEYMATIKAWVLDEDDGATTVNWELFPIYELIFTMQHFFGIEMDTAVDADGELDFDKMLETYDELVKLDIKNLLFEEELMDIYADVRRMLDQEIKVKNSIGVIVGRELKRLVDKIPNEKEMAKILKQIPKALEKVSPETLDILKNIGNK